MTIFIAQFWCKTFRANSLLNSYILRVILWRSVFNVVIQWYSNPANLFKKKKFAWSRIWGRESSVRLNNQEDVSFFFFLRFSPGLVDIAMRIASLCAVLSLLVVLFSTTEVTSCYVKANGCSIPGNLPFFYKRTFKPACDKHDVCYYCVRLASFSYYKFIRMTATMSHLHK